MNIGLPATATWVGDRIDATYTITTDGKPLEVDTSGFRPTFKVPPAGAKLTVSAIPDSDRYWPSQADFTVETDGTITSDDPGQSEVVSLGFGSARMSVLVVRAWRLRDVSQQVAELLEPAAGPEKRDGKPATDVHEFDGTDYPPADWSILKRNGIHFIDTNQPVVGKRIGTTLGSIADFAGETVALELKATKPPRLISVAWPNALAREDGSEPIPFLIYFRPGVGQNVDAGFFEGDKIKPKPPPYPFNHDYALFGQYQFLWYSADPLTKNPFAKGIPHQLQQAEKNIVTVIPCNAVGGEFGDFMRVATIHEVLLEIQAFMFARAGIGKPPSALGRVAAGAFSSGNSFLSAILAAPKNRTDPFYKDVLKELYLFDPPGNQVEGLVAEARRWAEQDPDDRRIALYTQVTRDAHAKILGVPSWKLPAPPYIQSTTNDIRIAAALDAATWKRTIEPILGRPVAGDFGFQEAHQLISAMLLTHAVATSQF